MRFLLDEAVAATHREQGLASSDFLIRWISVLELDPEKLCQAMANFGAGRGHGDRGRRAEGIRREGFQQWSGSFGAFIEGGALARVGGNMRQGTLGRATRKDPRVGGWMEPLQSHRVVGLDARS